MTGPQVIVSQKDPSHWVSNFRVSLTELAKVFLVNFAVTPTLEGKKAGHELQIGVICEEGEV